MLRVIMRWTKLILFSFTFLLLVVGQGWAVETSFLLLIGAPGSGKGTQAKLLKEALHIPHISTGDILRQHIREKTEFGLRVQPFMSAGKVFPDDIGTPEEPTEMDLMLRAMKDRFEQADCENGFILEGFPRTTQRQAELLEHLMASLGKKIDAAIFLDADAKEIEDRISNRLNCSNPHCGTTFHRIARPPRVPGKCDACGADLFVRDDDRPEVLRSRLEIFQQNIKAVIDYYSSRGNLARVKSEGAPEEIQVKILEQIQEIRMRFADRK